MMDKIQISRLYFAMMNVVCGQCWIWWKQGSDEPTHGICASCFKEHTSFGKPAAEQN